MKVVRRVDVWLKGHTRKNENPVNEAVKETMVMRKSFITLQSIYFCKLRSATYILLIW